MDDHTEVLACWWRSEADEKVRDHVFQVERRSCFQWRVGTRVLDCSKLAEVWADHRAPVNPDGVTTGAWSRSVSCSDGARQLVY
jgi:hypothetical protein